ncbi:hypothetical protein V500_09124 [Pseudogymnoascus sp. VKM F-4518 (FW-2643)]|nr:hypothetical protein V500_09124 [Pseudogymnoascus sp. VKM F-4518 (FW-2643)]
MAREASGRQAADPALVWGDATDEIKIYHSPETLPRMDSFRIGYIDGPWVNFEPPISGGIFRPYEGEDNMRKCVKTVTTLSGPRRHQLSLKRMGPATRRLHRRKAGAQQRAGQDGREPAGYCHVGQTRHAEDYHSKYRALHQKVEENGHYECRYLEYGKECTRYVSIFVLSMTALKYEWYMTPAMLLGLFWHQIMSTAQDAGHMAVTHNYIADTLIGIFIADFCCGLSIGWWRSSHNVHHLVPNHPGHDPDIKNVPLFANSPVFLQSLRPLQLRLRLGPRLRDRHQVPEIHLLPLMGIARFNLYLFSWLHLISPRASNKGTAAWTPPTENLFMACYWYLFGYRLLWLTLPTWTLRVALSSSPTSSPCRFTSRSPFPTGACRPPTLAPPSPSPRSSCAPPWTSTAPPGWDLSTAVSNSRPCTTCSRAYPATTCAVCRRWSTVDDLCKRSEVVSEMGREANGRSEFRDYFSSDSLPLGSCQPLLNPESRIIRSTFEQLFDMENDVPNLQCLFALAFRRLHTLMGREEMGKFCVAIAKNEKYLSGKSKWKLPMDLESIENVKESVPEQLPRKRKRALDKSERLDMTAQNFKKNAVSNVKRLIEGHWHELSTKSSEITSCQPESDQPKRILRLNQHLELLQETKADQIRWMWKGIKLIRHLRSYEDFLDESGYTNKKKRKSQKARDKYLRYLYEGRELDEAKEKDARTGLTEHLRYGRRWMIFIDALTAGFVIVCGPNFATKVIRTGYTLPDLETLASQIKESRIYRLCEAFTLPSEQLLNVGRLDGEYTNRDFVLAEVQRVSPALNQLRL